MDKSWWSSGQMKKLWKNYERVMNKSWISHKQVNEQVVNKSTTWTTSFCNNRNIFKNILTSCERDMNKFWKNCEKLWTSHEKVMNRLWTCRELVMNKCHEQVIKNSQQIQFLEKSWTSCEQVFQQVLNNSGTSCKQVVKKLWTSVNKSWTRFEQVVNKSWISIWKRRKEVIIK